MAAQKMNERENNVIISFKMPTQINYVGNNN